MQTYCEEDLLVIFFNITDVNKGYGCYCCNIITRLCAISFLNKFVFLSLCFHRRLGEATYQWVNARKT